MELVIAWRLSTVGEAEGARSALDAAGIDVALADDEIVGLDWLYSNAVGGVKVLVRDEDWEESTEILSTAAVEVAVDDAGDAAAEEIEETIGCPACGSSEVARIPRLRLFFFFALAVCGVGFAVHQPNLAIAGVVAAALIMATAPSHRCMACGERWIESPQIERIPEPPPPNVSDTIERRCPRCGSPELYRIRHRRLIALSLLFSATLVVMIPTLLILPKHACDTCGFRK